MKIYLDVCCLNRPFDDQTQDRIHLESEAVLLILEHCQTGTWQLIGSDIIDFETSMIPDTGRRQKLNSLTSLANVQITMNAGIEKRALNFEKSGIKPTDALHLACAEKAKVDVLLTTDDKFLQNVLKCKQLTKTRVNNPLNWLIEVIRNEHPKYEP